MTIRIDVTGAAGMQRMLFLLRSRFPKQADFAEIDAARKSRSEFHRQAVAITGISRTRIVKSTAKPRHHSTPVGRHAGFVVKRDRPGAHHFKTTKFEPGAGGITHGGYAGRKTQTVEHAFQIKGREELGIFARTEFRPGLRASNRGVDPRRSSRTGLVHRLPIFRFRGVSASRIWDISPKLRAAVTKVGQDALEIGVDKRLLKLVARGKL